LGENVQVSVCVFCDIVAGVMPADVVLADDHAVAFLDRSPVFKGHVLVVPRSHVVTLADLPASELAPYFSVVQRVSGAVPVALEADGTFVAINNVVSQSVPHLHVHVVPRRRKDGLRGFFWPRVRYSDDAERTEYAARLRAVLRAL
jgi:histidine triad (HIT) family protein